MSNLDAEHVPLPESRSSPAPVESESPHQHQSQGGKEELGGGGTKGSSGVGHEAAAQGDESEDEVDGMVGNEVNSPEYENVPVITNVEAELEDREEDDGNNGEESADPSNRQFATSVNAIVRAPSPSSRTSTPPIGAGSSLSSSKKFSSININKKFLSKTASPAAGSPAAGAKSGLSATSPIPISSSASRLLSTKLTTVPSSKSSTSPHPPGSAAASPSTSSPWAKPAVPVPIEGASELASAPGSTLHHPAPTRARILSSTPTAAMGSGQGIVAYPPKNAWKAVTTEGKRAPLGLSRDFPTTKEIADIKRAQQMAAQAQAAHNQAILQGLNAFTQLDSNTHHWEDEDEDDQVIDFGDGVVYPHHDPPVLVEAPGHDLPVPQSERFVEDFDRSWPRQRPPVVETLPSVPTDSPRRPDGDRVLFNANSNRLEPSSARQPPPQQQPTRLITRPELAGRTSDRPLPPQLPTGPTDSSLKTSSQKPAPSYQLPLNPSLQTETHPSQPHTSTAAPVRQAWNTQRNTEHQSPTHHTRQELPPQSTAFTTSLPSSSHAPQRSSFSQVSRPHVPPASTQALQAGGANDTPSVPPMVDNQTAEMHNAAEKARLRRLAEEQEREAAAERARRKAKELEERFGSKESSKPAAGADANVPKQTAPPGSQKPAPGPSFTIAQRPQTILAKQAVQQSAGPAAANPALLHRPMAEPRDPGSWRSRNTDSRVEHAIAPDDYSHPVKLPREALVNEEISRLNEHVAAPNNSAIESGPMPSDTFTTPQSPGRPAPPKDRNFDSMLARIQAAMAEARASPSIASPAQVVAELPTQKGLPGVAEQAEHQSLVEQVSSSAGPSSTSMEYFNVTQREIPKSPRPAWRTYAVRLPKISAARSTIAPSRQKAFDSLRRDSAVAFIMTFDPPIDTLSRSTLSRSELLLPQPHSRPFSKQLDLTPIVSISPRQFEPFARKQKKKTQYEDLRNPDLVQPSTAAESLLPAASSTLSAQLRGRIPPTSNADGGRWSNLTEATQGQLRKSRSPVKSSVAAKAEREGVFSSDGVGINVSGRKQSMSDIKPGVRFMVSSELDGDSLLDEVNKMSLETLGEGDDKPEETGDGGDTRTTGSETPKTPPSHSGTSSRGHASSPSGASSTPWSKSSVRSSSQHDHLKSVWDHTPVGASDGPSRTADAFSAPIAASASLERDNSTPMYPSLNAPSSADPPAPQPLPSTMKMAYSQSQPFSPTGAASTFASVRQPPAQYGYSTPEQALAYQRTAMNGAVNGGYAAQQGVWSPSAFGAGYGFSKPAQTLSSLESKAAMAFNAMPNKEGNGYTNATAGDYRYVGNPSTLVAYQNQSAQQSPTTYGQSPYARQHVTSPPATMYGYGYGAPGSQATNVRARFTANGGEYQYTAGGVDGGYYGGVGVNAQHQQQSQHHHQQQHNYGYGDHGAIGQHQNQASRLGGGTGANAAGAVGGQRKWGQ